MLAWSVGGRHTEYACYFAVPLLCIKIVGSRRRFSAIVIVETQLESIVMMSSSRIASWSKTAWLTVSFALAAVLSLAAGGPRDEVPKGSAPAAAKAEAVDWNRALDAWRKSLTTGGLTPDDETCLARAKATLAKQGIDVKRADEIAKKALGGGQLSPDEQAYLERV